RYWLRPSSNDSCGFYGKATSRESPPVIILPKTLEPRRRASTTETGCRGIVSALRGKWLPVMIVGRRRAWRIGSSANPAERDRSGWSLRLSRKRFHLYPSSCLFTPPFLPVLAGGVIPVLHAQEADIDVSTYVGSKPGGGVGRRSAGGYVAGASFPLTTGPGAAGL